MGGQARADVVEMIPHVAVLDRQFGQADPPDQTG